MTSEQKDRLHYFINESLMLTGKYLLARTVTALISIVICLISFALIGVPYWGIAAFITGISNFIPVAGAWLAAIAVGGFTWYAAGWETAVLALLVMLGVQIIEQLVVEPLILGRSLQLKPLAVCALTLSAGAVFGFTGLVVAVPAAAVMKLAYEVLYLKKSFDSGSGGSAAKSPRQNNYGSEKS